MTLQRAVAEQVIDMAQDIGNNNIGNNQKLLNNKTSCQLHNSKIRACFTKLQMHTKKMFLPQLFICQSFLMYFNPCAYFPFPPKPGN